MRVGVRPSGEVVTLVVEVPGVVAVGPVPLHPDEAEKLAGSLVESARHARAFIAASAAVAPAAPVVEPAVAPAESSS